MYQGKHLNKPKCRSLLPALLAAVLILSAATVGVWAYLKLATPPVTNTFTPAASVAPVINETFDGNTKSNVTISVGETGYSVYVRAAIIVTWQDADGNVYFTQPVEGTDYTITYGSDWKKGTDGYWYYNKIVESVNPLVTGSGTTTALIETCTAIKEAPVSGYTLNVKIVAQTIQSAGTTDANPLTSAMESVWPSSPLS